MKISVDSITASPSRLQFEEENAWWQSRASRRSGLSEELAEPLRVDVSVHKVGEELFLEGQLFGSLDLECGRCLARYRHPLRETFQLVLEPAGDRLPADPEASESLTRDGLCLCENFESGWYRGGEIHLDSLCFEVISLALPAKPLCREDCAGLCARCGAELNQSACNCQEIPKDSPFAVLAALRDEHGRS